MDKGLQVTFRNMDHSDAVEDKVRERAKRLEKYFDHITSCRVTVEAPESGHHKRKLFHIDIELGLPGKDLVVNRHPNDKRAHENVYLAIRDAFDVAQRRLQDHARKMNGKGKSY